ncbi:hypothetical protein D3C81_1942620 [compost metagenome]
MPLINAILLTFPASSRTYSVKIGAIDPVATWIIIVVTNRLNTSFGFFSEPMTSRACSISFFDTGVKFSRIKNAVSRKQAKSTLAVMKNTGRNP